MLPLQQMLHLVKHVVDGNFVYQLQQESIVVHCACNTVELQQHEICDFLSPELWPWQPKAEPYCYKI